LKRKKLSSTRDQLTRRRVGGEFSKSQFIIHNRGIATGIATGNKPKKKTSLKRDWSFHHSYFWKTMENHKNKASLQKTKFLDPGVSYA